MELKPGHGRMRRHWSEAEAGALGEQPSNLSLVVLVDKKVTWVESQSPGRSYF